MKPIEKKCFLCPQNKFGKCLLYPLPADYLSKNEINIIPNKVCILNLQDTISIDSSSAVIYKISYKLLLN